MKLCMKKDGGTINEKLKLKRRLLIHTLFLAGILLVILIRGVWAFIPSVSFFLSREGSLILLAMFMLPILFALGLLCLRVVCIHTNERFFTVLKHRRALSISLLAGFPVAIYVLTALPTAYALSQTGLRDLPEGAKNGEWAAMAVAAESNIFLRDSHDDFEGIIVRAEVIGERSEVLRLEDTSVTATRHLYTLHTLKVLDVYRGRFEVDAYRNLFETGDMVKYLAVGDIFEFRQLEKHESIMRYQLWRIQRDQRRRGSFTPNRTLVYDTWIPLSVGDDLILFLVYGWWPLHSVIPHTVRVAGQGSSWLSHYFISNPIQGAYRYTPAELRGGDENFAFEPVNPHNNLILTQADLLRFRELSE